METSRAKPLILPSASLPGGEIAEMIYRPDAGDTCFLVGSGDALREEHELSLPNGSAVLPYPADNTLLLHRVVLLPSGIEEYGTTGELRERVRQFIHRYMDLSPLFEEVAAVYVLFSWIYDDFSELPYLRVRGDYGSGKSRFLQTVGSICYTPIFASGASTVSPLFRILDSFRGTLILDEADFRFSDEKAEIVKILNNGNAKGFPVLRAEVTPSKAINPTAFAVFGPKLLATRGSFQDRALESRSITEDLGTAPLRHGVPLNLPAAFHEEAAALRRQLLLFRFRNHGRERDLTAFEERGLSPRLSQLFAPLLSTVDEEAVRGRLLVLAARAHRDLLESQATDPAYELLSCLIRLAGTEPRAYSVQEITEGFVRHADLDRRVTPRYVGYLLRHRLFLKPERRGGVFVLPERELLKLPVLVERFGVAQDIEDVGDIREGKAPKDSQDAKGSETQGELIA